MTPEEREKAVAILANRYASKITRVSDKSEGLEYATETYRLYSDEALLNLIITPIDN